MEFRKSQTGDVDQIVRIAEDAKAFLKANGISQWQRGAYPDRAIFASDVENGIGYVLADGARVRAVCAVTFGEEPSYGRPIQGAWLTGGGAAYATVHRCAVAADARGRGVAARLLRIVCALAANHGVGSVRVDTHPDNKPMRAALAKAGFSPCVELRLERCDEAGDLRVGYERLTEPDPIAPPPGTPAAPSLDNPAALFLAICRDVRRRILEHRASPPSAAAPEDGTLIAVGEDNIPRQHLDADEFKALLRVCRELDACGRNAPPATDDPKIAAGAVMRRQTLVLARWFALRLLRFLAYDSAFHPERSIQIDALGALGLGETDAAVRERFTWFARFAAACAEVTASDPPTAAFSDALLLLNHVADVFFNAIVSMFPVPQATACRRAFAAFARAVGTPAALDRVDEYLCRHREMHAALVAFRAAGGSVVLGDVRLQIAGLQQFAALSPKCDVGCEIPAPNVTSPKKRKSMKGMPKPRWRIPRKILAMLYCLTERTLSRWEDDNRKFAPKRYQEIGGNDGAFEEHLTFANEYLKRKGCGTEHRKQILGLAVIAWKEFLKEYVEADKLKHEMKRKMNRRH